MAAKTHATPEMLNNAAKVATQAGEDITLSLTRLLNEVEQQSAAFRGQAGTSFQNVSSQLGQELRSLLEALIEMAGNVSQSGQHFGSTDAAASSEIAKVAHDFVPGAGSVANSLRG
ncbi:MAG TPA: WXG100 family type VII secretion target [Micromonosporaceae bacterium]